MKKNSKLIVKVKNLAKVGIIENSPDENQK